MPTTTANIDLILRRVSNATRQEILDAMDEMQLIVYSQNSFQTLKIESTGLPPIIQTTQGQYEYDCPADCRVAAAVFALDPPLGYQRNRATGPRREYFFRNRAYVAIDAECRPASIDDVAKVYFREDPGTTTDKYYLPYYIQPTRLTDESIQLVLEEHTHYSLRQAVIAMFTSEQYGKSGFDDQVIERAAKKIRSQLNRGYGSSLGITPIQPEYRQYPDTLDY